MDQIEQKVKLPKGAGKLEECNRFYAVSKNGHVNAVYTQLVDAGLPIEQRKWVANSAALPLIMDGGCSVIRVEFDQRSRKVIYADCNGDT